MILTKAMVQRHGLRLEKVPSIGCHGCCLYGDINLCDDERIDPQACASDIFDVIIGNPNKVDIMPLIIEIYEMITKDEIEGVLG